VKLLIDIFQESDKRPSCISIGNFDGVHIGHQKILTTLNEYAKKDNLNKIIITFKPHPVIAVKPNKNFGLIVSDYADKLQYLKSFNPDILFLQDFTEKLKELSPTEFLEILINKFNMKYLIVGDDYNFGKNRAGGVDFLRSMESKYNFKLIIVPEVSVKNNGRVTSSYLRDLLKAGEIESVNRYLFTNFFLKGFVTTGKERGRTLGYPTANFKPYTPHQIIPKEGVYLTKLSLENKIYNSITNIGKNPTFNEKDLTVETHILDFNEMIYFKKIKIEFIKKLRDEIKFDSKESLIKQLNKDKKIAVDYFNNL